MNIPLHLLMIEDMEDHALLIVRELQKGGFSPTIRRVETLEDLRAALDGEAWDAIISDFRLQGFDGMQVLKMAVDKGLDIPFILVSGAIGEERAAEIMKAGASDFIMKGNWARLVPSLERELQDAKIRRERRQIAEELTRYRENLEELVQARTREIEELNSKLRSRAAELELANDELEAFTRMVTHDIRAPLNTILVGSETLAGILGQRLDPTSSELLKAIGEQAIQMSELVTALLDFTRHGCAELGGRRVGLSKLARQIATRLQTGDPGRRVRFSIADGLFAQADERLMRVVMENILGNAWKYTSKKPTATIEFGVTQTVAGETFFIRDDGIGFDGARAAEIFKPFQRLHSREDFAGHGLGLASVQRIIQRHGGQVWAEGAPGAGATVYFTLCASSCTRR